MEISKLILNKRRELNLTQKDLAEKLNVTDKTISRWETGVQLPDVIMLKTLSEVLQINILDFFEDIPIKEINNNEKYDYCVINKYKVNNYINIGILLLCFLLLTISFVGGLIEQIYFYTRGLGTWNSWIPERTNVFLSIFACLVLSVPFVLLGSFTYMTIINIKYKKYYLEKVFQEQYKDVKNKFWMIYIIIFIITISLLIIYFLILVAIPEFIY